MEKKKMTISMLKYQIQRYQEMGNGIKCQALQKELNKLIAAK